MNLDWLIIGGGIHGVHLAVRLLGQASVAADRIRIVDPGEQLLERWKTCTAETGMTHLRSPAVHNLDVHPMSLQRFAHRRKKKETGLFAYPYNRPSLRLFNAHCDKVIDEFGLRTLHVRDRVLKCTVGCSDVGIRLASGGEVTAQNVVLALGSGEQPRWPDWARKNSGNRVHHVFEPGFNGWPSEKETIAVVGGGISAGQVALRLLHEGHDVHLISRHPLRKHQFDSEPGWLGPKLMTGFNGERDVNRRRDLIQEARHSGSVSPDVERSLRRAIAHKRLHWYEEDIGDLYQSGDELKIQLVSGASLQIQRLLLATGFSSKRPGGALVEELATSASLPCADCGYPVVDRALRWHPRIYVSGPLAELELGPVSRNISGARRAGDRLVQAVRASSPI